MENVVSLDAYRARKNRILGEPREPQPPAAGQIPLGPQGGLDVVEAQCAAILKQTLRLEVLLFGGSPDDGGELIERRAA